MLKPTCHSLWGKARVWIKRGLMGSLFALASGSAALSAEITIFAAASLKTALDQIVESFEADTGRDVAVSYAGSSILARQIQYGAPADLFISANSAWMDVLEADGLLVAGSRFDLLSNQLVLVAHGEDIAALDVSHPTELIDQLGENRLAMALHSSVPAGIYAKAALESLGHWTALSPQIAQADNARAALAFVAVGEAPLGIVYASDALASDDVSVIATFDKSSHPPIVYPIAQIDGAGDAASLFTTHLQSDTARKLFEIQSFIVLGDIQ